MAKKKLTGKGNAGNMGGKARASIKRAQTKGFSIKQIAAGVGRDDDTIANIRSGNINNPPNDLTTRLGAFSRKPAKKKKK